MGTLIKTRQNAWLHISSGDPHKATAVARSPVRLTEDQSFNVTNPVGARSLTIFNPGDSDILIRSIWVSPELYTVMKSDSVRDALESASGKQWMAVLGPKESVEFPLVAKDSFKEQHHRPVRISVSWYKTHSPRWPYIPVVVTTSTTNLRELT
jgi:hypothetical protein